MNWLNRAEARFGSLAIPGLPRILVAFNALVYLLYLYNPGFLGYLTLRPDLVMEGQVWRLLTYIFIPGVGGGVFEGLFILLYLLYIYFLGSGLERAMGAFRFNVYYGLGMFFITLAAFLFPPAFGAGVLNTTLLFAFARYFPDVIIYVMFILPLKIKWMAWITAFLLAFQFLGSSWSYRASLVACLMNYVLFFGAEHVRAVRQRSFVSARRQRFEEDMQQAQVSTLHECVVCHRTESADPYLDFRVARDGKEYCVEHLPKAGETRPSPEPPGGSLPKA